MRCALRARVVWWLTGRKLLVAALSVALCWPLARVHWFESHEYADYVLRTVEYAEILRSGTPYPRWCPDFYGGYGSPFFNFYAPLVYFLAAVLVPVVGSATGALKAVVLLGSLLSGLGAFLLVELETRRRDAAFVCATLYLCSSYRLADVTWRGDLAEFFALGLLPLSLFAYRRIVHETDPRLLPRAALFASLVHAALVFSHTLVGLWGTGIVFSLIVLSGTQLLRRRSLERALLLVASFVAALLISALYTLPALMERGHVRTEVMVAGGGDPTNNWLMPKELWQEGPFRMAYTLSISAGLFALAFARTRRLPRTALPWLFGALSLTVLVLPHATPIWRADVIPFGDFIQFPWRLLGPAALGAAVAAGIAWAELFRRGWRAEATSALIAAVAIWSALPATKLRPMPRVEITPSEIRGRIFSGTAADEYLPRVVKAAPRTPALGASPLTDALRVELAKGRSGGYELLVDVERAASLELHLHAFPGWKVRNERGPARIRLATSERGLVALEFPAPGRYALSVAFGSTPARDIALVLSLLGLFGLLPVARRLSGLALERRPRALEVAPGLEGASA